MPTYKYEAAYPGGEKVSGVVEALNRADAVAQIRQSCEVVLSLREVPKGAGRERMSHFHRIRAKSLALVCQQFAIILKAGLPLVQAVDLVAGQTEDKALGSLLRQVSEDVSNGWSLSYSLAQRGEGRLPITFRESVRAGEESGDLTASFRRMADYFQRMEKTRQSVMGALTYPAFVILVAVVVVSIIMGYAVPTFTRMFENMSVELPWITVVLIAVSHFFQKYVLVILGLLALGLLGLRMYALTEKGGTALSRLQLGLPVIGEIVRMSGASQFCHTMSTLLTAGMPILQSIEIAGRAISNQCISQEILDTLPGVEGGRSLGECMGYSQELPPMLVQMTAVGEATGSMEATLQVLAEYYDNEVDVRIKRALALLEPSSWFWRSLWCSSCWRCICPCSGCPQPSKTLPPPAIGGGAKRKKRKYAERGALGWNARKGEEGRFKAGIHRRDETLYTIILGRGKPLNNKVLESEREERNMKNLKNKLKKQGGFTLVEMLTVVAIIAILIAISIPMVTGALDRASKATDVANVRAAKALTSIEYLTNTSFKADEEWAYDALKGKLVAAAAGDDVTPYGKASGNDGNIIWVQYSEAEKAVQYQWGLPGTSAPTGGAWKTEIDITGLEK